MLFFCSLTISATPFRFDWVTDTVAILAYKSWWGKPIVFFLMHKPQTQIEGTDGQRQQITGTETTWQCGKSKTEIEAERRRKRGLNDRRNRQEHSKTFYTCTPAHTHTPTLSLTDLSGGWWVTHGCCVLSVQLGSIVIQVQRFYGNHHSGHLTGVVWGRGTRDIRVTTESISQPQSGQHISTLLINPLGCPCDLAYMVAFNRFGLNLKWT